MRDSIPRLFGPIADERHGECLDRCENELNRCSEQTSVRELTACYRKHQRCADDCDREEGVLKV